MGVTGYTELPDDAVRALKRVFWRPMHGRQDVALRTAAARALTALVCDARTARRVRRCRGHVMQWAQGEAAEGARTDNAALAARALLAKLDGASASAVARQARLCICRLCNTTCYWIGLHRS